MGGAVWGAVVVSLAKWSSAPATPEWKGEHCQITTLHPLWDGGTECAGARTGMLYRLQGPKAASGLLTAVRGGVRAEESVADSADEARQSRLCRCFKAGCLPG